MDVLHVLKVAGALLTIGTGFISLLFPLAVTGFTGLAPQGRGVLRRSGQFSEACSLRWAPRR